MSNIDNSSGRMHGDNDPAARSHPQIAAKIRTPHIQTQVPGQEPFGHHPAPAKRGGRSVVRRKPPVKQNRHAWHLISAFNLGVLLISGAALAAWQINIFGGGLSDSFAKANGRLEAERIDIATKCPGKLNEILVREGDTVTAGQLLARVDATELEAQLLEAEANLRQNKRLFDQATALLSQRQNERALAGKQLERAESLKQRGYSTEEMLDGRRSTALSAQTAVDSAEAQVSYARAGVDAGTARVSRMTTVLRECEIKAPHAGSVQHRVASPGEVLPVGGKILTLLDTTDVYMTVFLPTGQAGHVGVNSEARLVLDADPDNAVPASVSFVATEAQFTPKYVETKSEREKLMFRVKVRIPPELIEQQPGLARIGAPGEAFLKLEKDAAWPGWLAASNVSLKPSGETIIQRVQSVQDRKGPLMYTATQQ